MGACPKCGQPYPIGAWPICQDASGKHGHTMPRGGDRIRAIHPSERPVVYFNPRTGTYANPIAADQPMHPKYQAQGYQRQELASPAEIAAYTKASGMVHEQSNWDNSPDGRDRAAKELEAPPIGPKPLSEKTKRDLIQAIS
jgi:hypothetical protein